MMEPLSLVTNMSAASVSYILRNAAVPQEHDMSDEREEYGKIRYVPLRNMHGQSEILWGITNYSEDAGSSSTKSYDSAYIKDASGAK